HQSNISTAVKDIKDLLDGKKVLPYSVLNESVKNATKALRDAQTELTFSDNGILAVDKNDPNLVTLFNSAGLGVSNDGGNTFENAITGEGINASTIYTGTMLADRIAGGVLSSLNGNTDFNLNSGNLIMKNAEFELGSGARIDFTSTGNRVQYRDVKDGIVRSAGFGVGKSTTDLPFAYSGTTGDRDLDTLSEYYSGAIWHTTRAISEGSFNSINGFGFQFRDKAVGWNKGLSIELEGSPVIRGINAHEHSYSLGDSSYRFEDAYIRNKYGSVGGAPSHNSKMNIEDVNGEEAFNYFNDMKVKSFYYKNDDYTNPYNRKVSPIIEQLEPTLEHLYKLNDGALDLNSNLFLLVKAMQHFIDETN